MGDALKIQKLFLFSADLVLEKNLNFVKLNGVVPIVKDFLVLSTFLEFELIFVICFRECLVIHNRY
jgi:hypothetical protein